MNAVFFCMTNRELTAAAQRAAKNLRQEGYDSAVVFADKSKYLPGESSKQSSDKAVSDAVRRLSGELERLAEKKQSLVLVDDPGIAKAMEEEGWYIAGILATGSAEGFSGVPYVFSEIDQVEPDSYLKAYQRMAGLPWEILTTDRLIVRETVIEDLESFYEIYEPAQMTKYMEGLFMDPADERRYMEDYIRNVYSLMGFGVWTVILRKDNTVIGRAGFSIRNGFDNLELGFLIGVPWQRQGYATEVCRAIMDYGKQVLGITRLLAFVREGNEISIRLLEKLGFHKEEKLELEEHIYGDTYLGENMRVSPGETEYRRYIRMAIEMQE